MKIYRKKVTASQSWAKKTLFFCTFLIGHKNRTSNPISLPIVPKLPHKTREFITTRVLCVWDKNSKSYTQKTKKSRIKKKKKNYSLFFK